MAKTPFSAKKHDINTLNSGYQYTTDDQMSIEALNNTIENSFYASQVSENVANQLSNLGANDKVEFKGSNPNILLNGNFTINQRGLPNYIANTNMDIVDKWRIQTEGSFDVSTNTFTSNTRFSAIRQEVKNFEVFRGKTLTYSIYVNNVEENTFGVNVRDGVETYLKDNLTVGLNTFTVTIDENATQLIFDIQNRVTGTHSIQLEYAKVELGSIATPFSPKAYEQELADCQCIDGGLATTYSNPNLLINGDFRVNQRGTSGTQNGNSKFPVDRWKTSALNAFCSTNLDTNGNVESVVAGITGVTTEGGRNALIYNFEDKDFKKLLGKQVTLSINYQELSADVANSVRIRFDSGVDNGAKVLTETSGIAVLTFTVNPNATQLVIQIAGTSSALNYSLKLNWVKLELGSIATPLTPRPYAEELAMCQRYFYTTEGVNATGLLGLCVNNYNQNIFQIAWQFPVTMRTTPTITMKGNWNVNVKNVNYAVTSIASQMFGGDKMCIRPTVENGPEIGNIGTLQKNYDGTAQITFDAEL